ncbi:hypothetical protein GGR51DRAFT_575802 [Nemania sp. FL0031]|nr:hypothetical protein GGR51DRAFT_575802 [Nemania sp. FL0031]
MTLTWISFTSPDGLPFPDNHFDFVHMQCLAGSVKDWNALFREVWRVLRPNGWFESIECPFQVHTSGLNFIKACPALASIESVLEEAGSVIGRPMVVDSNDLDQSLKTAGFTIETNKCVPCPLSPQTPDVHQSIAAHFLKQALLTDIEGYFARILSEGHFWDENAVKRYADALKLELNDEVSMELFKPFINVQFMDGFKIQ